MKKFHHVFDSTIPIYGSLFGLIISNDVEQTKKRFEGHFDDFIYAHALLRERKGFNWYVIVLNPYDEDHYLTHGTIAHEAYHITTWIMRAKGMQHDPDNNEAECYLIQYFVDLIYEKLEELKMLNRIKLYKN